MARRRGVRATCQARRTRLTHDRARSSATRPSRYFVTVPEGATALQVNLGGIATGSQTRFIAINPYGVPVESTSRLDCYTNFSDAARRASRRRGRTQNPMPGVWELEVESRRTSPIAEQPVHAHRRGPGRHGRPGDGRAAAASPPAWPHAGHLDGHERLRSGHGHAAPAARSAARLRAGRPSPTATSPGVHGRGAGGRQRLDVTIGNTTDLGRRPRPVRVYLGGVLVAQTPTVTRRSR